MSIVESAQDYLHEYTFRGRRPDLHLDYTDTEGGAVVRDVTQRADLDKPMAVGIRNDLRGPFSVDTWGREGGLPYLASEAHRLLTSDDEGQDFSGRKVQLDINGAPRDGSTENGHHFLAAQVGEKLWLVGPPACFRDITGDIRGNIYRVTGFSETQQFRSSAAGKASRKRNRLVPEPQAREWIPARKQEIHVANLDRFGNVRLGEGAYNRMTDTRELVENDLHGRHLIQIQVGENRPQTVEYAADLSLKEIGALTKERSKALLLPVLYRDPNRGHRPTIATPWIEGESELERVRRSAFYHLSNIQSDEQRPDPDSERFIQEGVTIRFQRVPSDQL